MSKRFTDSNFSHEVLSSNKLCVVDFWAQWCGPCREMAPIIEELSDKYADKIIVGKLDVDENPEYSKGYGVTSIPVIMFFRNRQVVYKHVGSISKEKLDKEIQEYLESPNKIQESLKSSGSIHEMPPLPGLPLSPKYKRDA
ncbi:thioredoxin [Chitinophaga arvensicola]|uniref:Thioredoxin n=1 Tax=Chitinophaga arvensicola TaxID=29529 RepID=A0A1I0S8E7_9BACT|nr:thioredoxin [Chitinophaga arvensicola]SEW52341.1 thioredoxin [Chitinophaga arvensicola]